MFNYKKYGHCIVECSELQKDKARKGSFQKDNFRNRFKKSLISTWNELDKEEAYEKDEDKSNLDFMALTSSEVKPDSDSGSGFEEDEICFKGEAKQ